MNIVILRGTLSSEPALRTLPSGSTLLSCEVTTRSPDGPARSVPVAWFDPPAASLLAVGTEVVVTTVLPVRQAKRVGRAIAAALADAETST